MAVQVGLDVLIATDFAVLHGKRVGVVCNQASIAGDIRHIVDIFYDAYQRKKFELKALFGPQHGLWGHTQDNMIEWEGGYRDPRTGITVYSLYGEHRRPTAEMLRDLDVLVIDLQDVGAKCYTFIWTMALCMDACREHGVAVCVLDRPNPIGGTQIEGPFRHGEFTSFVGLHDLPSRHGMTIAEIARYLQSFYYPDVNLQVVKMEGWRREMYFAETGLPFAMPSPNIPVPDTTVVYPGQCLLEATNLSEGRGTTRPFELFGAGYINAWEFAEALHNLALPGIYFRPLLYQPTFHKFASQVCGGVFMHVTDRWQFKPFLTTIAILREAIRLYPNDFRWKNPPYEYEFEKMPIDILVGNSWIREMLNDGADPREIEANWLQETEAFRKLREPFLLY
jgi:uncharacterized protein YbbC (DUF1343 family)